jgi:hypothetical protein
VRRFSLSSQYELLRDAAAIGRLIGSVLVWSDRSWEVRSSGVLIPHYDFIEVGTGAWAGWFQAAGPFGGGGSLAIGQDVFDWQRPNVFRSRRVLARRGEELARFQPRVSVREKMTVDVAPELDGVPWLPLIVLAGAWVTLVQNEPPRTRGGSAGSSADMSWMGSSP